MHGGAWRAIGLGVAESDTTGKLTLFFTYPKTSDILGRGE